MKTHCLYLFVLTLFLILSNCKEDEAFPLEEITNENSVLFPDGFTLKSLTKDEFPHQKQISEKIEAILDLKPLSNSFENKSVNNQNHSSNPLLIGLTILDNYAKYVEYPNGFHTYTFDTNREVSNGLLENISLIYNGEGYDAFLLQYDVSKEKKEKLLIGQQVELELNNELKIIPLTLEEQEQLLQSKTTTYYFAGDCLIAVVNVHQGVTSIQVFSCSDGGSDNANDSSGTNNNDSGNGSNQGAYPWAGDDSLSGGNGGGNFNENPFTTAPISAFDEAVEDLEDCMGNGLFSPQLTDEQIDFLNDDVELVEEMLGECKQNGGTFEEILKEVSKKRECKKIKELLFSNPEYKTKLQNLASEASTATVEKGIALDVNGNDIPIPDGVGGKVDIPKNPDKKYRSMAHLHDLEGSSGNGTYSVYSLGDIVLVGRIFIVNHKIKLNKFVSFLATAKGTYYAFTISNSFKFKQFFEFLNYQLPLTDEQRKLIKSKNDIAKKYFEGTNPTITVENDDNDEMLKQFLKFLEEADMGVSVFKTDANFNNFDLVEYNSEIDDVDTNNPCE